jgi:hypothetical protein
MQGELGAVVSVDPRDLILGALAADASTGAPPTARW